ncbi:MAG TPA: FliI/YscN family ATPase [Tepidisphaeraceae bacterium]|jgi:flagellum-specific ATP synthase
MRPLAPQLAAVETSTPMRVVGRVQAMTGLTIEAAGVALPTGSLCQIKDSASRTTLAEVIGFRGEHAILMPLCPSAAIAPGDLVENLTLAPLVQCSKQLLGRVLDGFGKPVDGKGSLPLGDARRLDSKGTPALQRQTIRTPISTGIRGVDALLTCGIGQRMGIFSGPGIGKSTLLSSIARNTSADVSVVALIGERGREVQEFLEKGLGPEGLKKCVVVVSTSDECPLLCVRAAKVAATVAEYFRDQGNNVLLLVDSLTRLCHAQRQIGLAAHEPPATRGYPPSAFALLPQILERAGRTATGSITAFYSVLVEGDDPNEPVADAVRGVADGHLWLSRTLASRGHFPAIEMIQSISRVREDVVDEEHLKRARRVLSLLGTYASIEDLVTVGAYVAGVNHEFDLAVQTRPKILEFLQQDSSVGFSFAQSRADLWALADYIEHVSQQLMEKK